uniref:SNF2P n=2 Tax=Hordeum vulgare subsp. vulgare TaxID=112509 RepID=M0XZM1_HORVV
MPTTPSPGDLPSRRPRRLIMDDDDGGGDRAPEVAAAGTQRVEAESAQDLVRNPLAPSSSSQPAAAPATGAQPAVIIEIDDDDRAPVVATGEDQRIKAESARDSVRNPLAYPCSSRPVDALGNVGQPAEIIEIPDDDDEEEDVGEAGPPGGLIKEEPFDVIDWPSLLLSSEEEEEAPRSDESTSSGGPDGGTASDGNINGIGTSRREGVCDDGEEKEEEEVEMPDAEDKYGAEEGNEEEEPEEEEEDKDEDEWEEEEEEEEEESEEDSEESDAEAEPGRRMLSDARGTGRYAGSRPGGDGSRAEIFLKRKFEGWYITKMADTASAGSTIASRTRSQRRCPDAKLLRQATRRKPYCVDTPSQSSSVSEEDDKDKPPPHPARSSSEDRDKDGRTGKRHPRRRGQNADDDSDEHDGTATRRRRGQNAAHRDEDFEEPGGMAAARRRGKQRMEEDNAADGGDERKKEGAASCRQAAGRKNKDFPADGWEQQGDVTFKRSSLLPPRRQGGQDRETYDDLLYSIFEGIETTLQNAAAPLDAPVPAQEQGGDPFPLVFSFGVQDEVVPDKTHLDDLWADLDLALDLDAESNKVSSHTCHKDAESDEHEIPAHGATFCKRGKHDLFHDDQIGVRCRKCDYIEIEIRDVFPSMAKESTDREPAVEHDDFDLFFDDILKSAGYEGESNMGGGDKTGVVWDLIPGVREDMFPHQREGFEFMWRKLAGGIDIEQLRHTMNTDTTSGCVISHAPGTGKTRLAITFVQSYLELFPHCRPVIIAPRGMLATWEQEFRKWNVKLPFHVLSSSEIQWDQDKTIHKLVSKDQGLGQKLAMKKLSQKSKMMLKLASWYEGSSIIGLSYSLYRNLAKGEGKDGEMQRNLLLEKPGLLVLDEGHTPRNKKSLIWKVLAEVSTEKRIILSGTPFQNNFLELYNILCLVKPKFAKDFACTRLSKKGVASTSQSSRAAPHLEEDDGKEFWSSLRISNITDEHITEIREKLGPFVHIHNGDILQKSLPGLRESVVILNPLPRQKEIIAMMEESAGKGFLDAEYKISLASIHPFLVTSTKLSDTEAAVVDKMKSVRLNPSEGVKTWFVFEIIRICEALHERVLVFSQYLEPLALIMDQLTRKLDWTEGKEILLMSGNVRVKQREALMEAFNDMNSEAKVMLASTKACCEGITLVGASRVVLLDVVWNPSVGRQAIGRAYRIGQEKIVYTYNLIAEGTKEKVKYDRQATKDHMSKLLFSNEPQPTGSNLSPELISNDKILEAMAAREDLKDMFVQMLPSH